MAETAVTTLVIESDDRGAVEYQRAMVAAQQAAAQAMAANDNWSRSLRTANDNARDAEQRNAGLTIGLRQLAEGALQAAESYAKKAAAAALAAAVLGTLIGVIFSLIAAYKAIKAAIDLVTEAWELGNKQLAEYVDLSKRAVESGLSVEFFQRLSKGADQAKLSVEGLDGALKKLTESTADRLGGSAGQRRMEDLLGAGNFAGNTGVQQLSAANSPEQRLRAIVSLIDQAMQKGERLAALDVAKTFLGEGVSANLAKDADYLNKMVTSADAIKSADLIPQASVDAAVALQTRLEEAQKILSQRWHPIQDLLTQGGIAMKEAWVNIVENIAAAFDWASRLMSKLGDAPSWFVQKMNEGATAFMNLTTTPEGRAAAEAAHGISSDPREIADLGARQRLATMMGNPANIAAARDQTNAISYRMRPDSSKDPAKKEIDETTSAYDRAEESLRKYIEVSNAAAETVDKGVAAQERARAMAQLVAAAMKDGLSREAAEAKAQLSGFADAAAAAAEKLARARIQSEISFGRNTAFLSQEDVAIAQQLKGLYPDVAQALASVEAQGLRAASSFRQISNVIETNLTSGLSDILMGTKSVSQGFTDMGLAIVKAIEQMIIKILIVEPLMRSLQAAVSGSGILSFAPASTANPTMLGGLYHSGGIVGSEPTSMRSVNPAIFVGAPRFHSGGIVGDEVPIIARRGERVSTPEQWAERGRAPIVNVTLVERPGAAGEVTTRQSESGGFDIEVAIAQIAAKGAVTPGNPLNRVLTDRMGAAPRISSR